MEVKVNLNNTEKVKNFSNKVLNIYETIDLKSGRYIVDAKSIMGIFSLNLSKDLIMIIHADDKRAEEIKDILKNSLLSKERYYAKYK